MVGRGWRIAGASVAGPQHSHAGEPCQDVHAIRVTQDGALVAVVSDGAGSAPFGGEGAQLACHLVVDEMARLLAADVPRGCSRRSIAAGRQAVRRAVARARSAALQRAQERGVGLSAFHATLVGAVMLPEAGGLFFHIGDGAALAIGEDGEETLLSPPANGEFSDTTYFFTQEDWRANLRILPLEDRFRTVVLMSDGVTELGLSHSPEGARPFMPFFAPICRYLAQHDRAAGERALHATLDSPAMRERTADDKTLVWASWMPE